MVGISTYQWLLGGATRRLGRLSLTSSSEPALAQRPARSGRPREPLWEQRPAHSAQRSCGLWTMGPRAKPSRSRRLAAPSTSVWTTSSGNRGTPRGASKLPAYGHDRAMQREAAPMRRAASVLRAVRQHWVARLARRAFRMAILAGTASGLVLHLLLTVAYVLPLTPAKMKYEGIVDPVVRAYADQKWSLFAPAPLAVNESLLVKCISEPEYGQVRNGGQLGSDAWADITRPLVLAHRDKRLAPYDRLQRPQGARLREFFTGSYDLISWHHACAKGSEEACRFESEVMRLYRVDAANVLTAIASSFCFEVGHSNTFAVALRLREIPVKPWSRRYDSSPSEPMDFDIGTFPAVRGIAPSNVFASYRP
jgi:hypothetical protein